MNKNIILDIKNLKKTYKQGSKSLNVLKDVSLQLKSSEIVALVGQSGAGKSTLLQCVGLLDTPTSGTITIENVQVSDRNEHDRTLIRREILGFVYQFHYLQPEFTALENAMMPLIIQGISNLESERRAKELLDIMGLSERFDHRPARLSGGEQQRVAIARALIHRPKILLADEPTGNLDEETSARIFDLLVQVTKEFKVSALIATHNLQLAAKMDRTLTLENGLLGV